MESKIDTFKVMAFIENVVGSMKDYEDIEVNKTVYSADLSLIYFFITKRGESLEVDEFRVFYGRLIDELVKNKLSDVYNILDLGFVKYDNRSMKGMQVYVGLSSRDNMFKYWNKIDNTDIRWDVETIDEVVEVIKEWTVKDIKYYIANFKSESVKVVRNIFDEKKVGITVKVDIGAVPLGIRIFCLGRVISKIPFLTDIDYLSFDKKENEYILRVGLIINEEQRLGRDVKKMYDEIIEKYVAYLYKYVSNDGSDEPYIYRV